MNERRDNIYVYLWEEFNTVYVGRTINPRSRHYAHKNRESESTYQFSSEHHVEHPKMIIIENGLTIEEGIEREKYWIEYYKVNEKYKVLNKSSGGQSGKKKVYTKEELIEHRKKYYERKKDYIREKQKKYYSDNREVIKRWRELNKEKQKKYAVLWRKTNNDKIKEYHKKWRDKNKEKIKKYYDNNEQKRKEYCEKNKEKMKQYQKVYRETHKRNHKL